MNDEEDDIEDGGSESVSSFGDDKGNGSSKK